MRVVSWFGALICAGSLGKKPSTWGLKTQRAALAMCLLRLPPGFVERRVDLPRERLSTRRSLAIWRVLETTFG